jgi:hypothetical protein
MAGFRLGARELLLYQLCSTISASISQKVNADSAPDTWLHEGHLLYYDLVNGRTRE